MQVHIERERIPIARAHIGQGEPTLRVEWSKKNYKWKALDGGIDTFDNKQSKARPKLVIMALAALPFRG